MYAWAYVKELILKILLVDGTKFWNVWIYKRSDKKDQFYWIEDR